MESQSQSQLPQTDLIDSVVERPAHLAPHGSTPPFWVLTDLFNVCLKQRKPERKRLILATWLKNWRTLVGLDFYPAMRLILPQKDRERATYGLKEMMLAKAFIAAFGLNDKSPDARALLQWKRPDENNKAAGDFPSVLYETIASRSSVEKGTMSIEELNNLLDDLSTHFRTGNKEKKAKVEQTFRAISEKCTPKEIRWIVRIILKDLNIGMKETSVFAVFHPDAHDLFNSCSDLKKVCWDLADPKTRLQDDEKNVRLFKPFAPMLCGRSSSLEQAVRSMAVGNEGFIMEEKLDGERIQLHKRGNEFFYCSRKGKDYTHLYGANIHIGSLTPHLAEAFNSRVTDVILDGEMMVWDPILQKALPFGNLKTFALDKTPSPDKPRPCFKIFDVPYINMLGKATTLTGHTLTSRLDILHSRLPEMKKMAISLFKEVPGRFEFALQKDGYNKEDVREFLEEVVVGRGEGLVLKRRRSGYILAGREAKLWVKVKPEYMDTMGESVDVLVVAGNFGNGRRGGRVSTLICAVRDDTHTLKGSPTYRTFVRIGTGLSLEDYNWVNSKPWQSFDPLAPPQWLKMGLSGREDQGNVYLEPEDSFIITVKAAQIIESDQYGSGRTMRFPRCKALRHDLKPEDCLNLSEMLEMAVGIGAGEKRKSEDDVNPEKKKRKVTTSKGVRAAQSHRGADVSGLESMSDLFEGMVFYVVKDPKESKLEAQYSKPMLEKLIHQHGGDFCQSSRGEDTKLVYSGTQINIMPIQPLVHAGRKDIIKPEWIINSVKHNKLLPLSKRYLAHATKDTKYSEEYTMEASDDDDATTDEEEEASDNDAKFPSDLGGDDAEGFRNEWLIAPGGNAEDATEKNRVEQTFARMDVRYEESDTEQESGDDTVDEEEEDNSSLAVSPAGHGLIKSPSPIYDIVAGLKESLRAKSAGFETSDSYELETDKIFTRLCFYLDTSDNARANGLRPSNNPVSAAKADSALSNTEKDIVANGGVVVADLMHPHLTHIVFDESDTSRRRDIAKQTSKPKRRYLVVRQFIASCLSEKTLLDEDAFCP